MDSTEAIEYINSVDWRHSRLGLERMQELLERLGNPHSKLKFIHIAGTNGKGSTSAMLASILTEAGYKTGLYTSPYINSFNERIQLDGIPISDEALSDVTARVRFFADKMTDHPTEFELVTAIALLYYYEQGCEIAVMEVGLGGRLDATNVIPTPEAAVITPISLDHTDILGDTIELIAAEKGGIIKTSGIVVSARQESGAERVLREICAEKNAEIDFLGEGAVRIRENSLNGQSFDFLEHSDMRIALLGAYQPQNAALAILAVDKLRKKGWSISEAALSVGLRKTRWPARFEIIGENPTVIVDGGHNPQCVDSIVANLGCYFGGKRIIFVTGVMADKDYQTMYRKILPLAKKVFTVTPDNPRALSAEKLAEFLTETGFKDAKACETVESGIKQALAAAAENDVVCAFGSFYMAGEIRRLFGK